MKTRVAVVAALVWAWFAGGVRTFTHPAEILTFLPGLAVLVLTLLPSSRPRSAGHRLGGADPAGPGALPWVALGVATVGWELTQLLLQPRSRHPTLSSMTDAVLDGHPARFLGYAAWLALGWLLVRDLRRARVTV